MACPYCGSWDTYYSALNEANICNDCGKTHPIPDFESVKFNYKDPDDIQSKVKETTSATKERKPRGLRKQREIGQVVGGYTVIALDGEKIIWERVGVNRNHYIVEKGRERLIATNDKSVAEEAFKNG